MHKNEPASKIQVLCIGRDLRGGGAEHIQLTLIQNIDRKAFQPCLFYLKRQGELISELPKDFEIHFGAPETKSIKLSATSIFFRLLRLAQNSDVIFGMQEGTPLYLAIVIGKLTGKPVLGWMHGIWSRQIETLPFWHRLFSSILYPWADQLIAVSEYASRDLQRFNSRLSNKTRFIPNPIPVKDISEKSMDCLPKWAEEIFLKTTLLSVGRLEYEKGYDLLIDSLGDLVRDGLDINLMILGEGTEREALENQVKRAGLAKRIFLPGFIENPYPFFKKARAFILSSRIENYATVLLEALLLDIPIIATDCPGPREVLDGGRYGILVPVGDSHAISNAIVDMFQAGKPSTIDLNEGNARGREHDVEQVIGQFEDLFQHYTKRSKRYSLASS